MNLRTAMRLATLSLSAVILGCASNEETTPAAAAPVEEKPLTRTESVEVNLTAQVKSIDQANRRMTLQGASGHQYTVIVDPQVQRLHEVMPGDRVNIRCTAKLLAELRPPTSGEQAQPISTTEYVERAPQSADPAAGHTRAVKVVTTVEAIDRPNMRVTLRGPMGDLATVRAKDAANLSKMSVGDTIVITYTESVAVALEKVAVR